MMNYNNKIYIKLHNQLLNEIDFEAELKNLIEFNLCYKLKDLLNDKLVNELLAFSDLELVGEEAL